MKLSFIIICLSMSFMVSAMEPTPPTPPAQPETMESLRKAIKDLEKVLSDQDKEIGILRKVVDDLKSLLSAFKHATKDVRMDPALAAMIAACVTAGVCWIFSNRHAISEWLAIAVAGSGRLLRQAGNNRGLTQSAMNMSPK